jgi:hypothetical protein
MHIVSVRKRNKCAHPDSSVYRVPLQIAGTLALFDTFGTRVYRMAGA